jgi:four helix bundle protein
MGDGSRRKGDGCPRFRSKTLPMQDPKDLVVYRRAVALAVAVYRLTEHFPSHERFGLTSQMRRGPVSIDSNISEGCGRWGRRELVHYLQMACSAASELAFQLTISAELEFGKAPDRDEVVRLTDEAQRMLNRLMVAKRTGRTSPRSKEG